MTLYDVVGVLSYRMTFPLLSLGWCKCSTVVLAAADGARTLLTGRSDDAMLRWPTLGARCSGIRPASSCSRRPTSYSRSSSETEDQGRYKGYD